MTKGSDSELIEAIFKSFRLMKESMAFNSRMTHMSLLQIQALVFLKKSGHAQMTDIAKYFKIELPSATSLVAKLSKLKLVKRESDKKDRRIVRIALTVMGDKLLEQAMEERSRQMQKNLSYLDAEDKKDLLRIMNRLILKMEELQNEK